MVVTFANGYSVEAKEASETIDDDGRAIFQIDLSNYLGVDEVYSAIKGYTDRITIDDPYLLVVGYNHIVYIRNYISDDTSRNNTSIELSKE